MPLILEINCKEFEGNMGEWSCVQPPRVLQKQDKKIRMTGFSRSKSGSNSEVTSQRDKQENKWSGDSSCKKYYKAQVSSNPNYINRKDKYAELNEEFSILMEKTTELLACIT